MIKSRKSIWYAPWLSCQIFNNKKLIHRRKIPLEWKIENYYLSIQCTLHIRNSANNELPAKIWPVKTITLATLIYFFNQKSCSVRTEWKCKRCAAFEFYAKWTSAAFNERIFHGEFSVRRISYEGVQFTVQ